MKVSTFDGTVTIDSISEIEQLIRRRAEIGMDEIWISGEEDLPALAILINRDAACVNYFGKENDDMWLSKSCGSKEVMFLPGGVEWLAPADAVIDLESAAECMRQFCADLKIPSCIEWQDGV